MPASGVPEARQSSGQNLRQTTTQATRPIRPTGRARPTTGRARPHVAGTARTAAAPVP